jgi:site-specific DNA-methyltransferase (adenine-specific)
MDQVLEEDLWCSFCGMGMARGSLMTAAYDHLSTCAENPDQIRLGCKACKKHFSGMAEMIAHIKNPFHCLMVGTIPVKELRRALKRKRAASEAEDEVSKTVKIRAHDSTAFKNQKQKIMQNMLEKKRLSEIDLKNPDFFGVKGKKYHLIYCDPPWEYDRKVTKGAALAHYQTMDFEQICSLPVHQLAAKDCMLLMWTTNNMMMRSGEVMKRWGFEFVTIYTTWVKTYPNGNPVKNMGSYTRPACEFIIVGKRGRAAQYRKNKCVSQVLVAPRPTKFDKKNVVIHSKKPEEMYAIFDLYFGEDYHKLNKIELFSRKKRMGWDVWGNETEKFNYEDYVDDAEILKQEAEDEDAAENAGEPIDTTVADSELKRLREQIHSMEQQTNRLLVKHLRLQAKRTLGAIHGKTIW